ncbi:MAG: HEAT repeat domain-containing protein [Syntrophobacteraceae bacterium]
MIFNSELTSLTGFLEHAMPFSDVAGLRHPHFMAYAAVFVSSITVVAIFGFLRRWRKKPPKNPEPSMMLFTKASHTEQISDNAAVISSLGSSSADTRAQAARMLGERRAKEASQSLVQLLQDDDGNVRFWTAWALGSIKEQSAVYALIDSLMDRDEGVRYRAVEALGEIGSGKALDALRPCLSDGSERVQKIAQWALRQINGETPQRRIPEEPKRNASEPPGKRKRQKEKSHWTDHEKRKNHHKGIQNRGTGAKPRKGRKKGLKSRRNLLSSP